MFDHLKSFPNYFTIYHSRDEVYVVFSFRSEVQTRRCFKGAKSYPVICQA